MTSLRKNFVYNSILTASTYVFPLLVFPYVTRALGVHNLGICHFVDSIIQYFILFSFLGMQTLATREIAKVKNDKVKLSDTFCSLFSLNMITTLISIIILFFCVFYIPKLYEHKELLFIGSAKILANTLLVEWFFIGTENFKYITIRTLLIRLLYVISVFVFVQDSSDYILYFTLTISMFVVNSIINMFCISRIIKISLQSISIRAFLKPFIILGSYQILTSMYTSFNVAYLGFISGETQVGYYSIAIKIYSILLGVFTAFTSVMLPRMSSLVERGETDEFRKKILGSIDVLLCFSMPIITIAITFAPTIINIVAGAGYVESILPFQIIMPLMVIIGYEQILVLQVLTPMNKDKAILINSIIGAIIGIICNLFFVYKYGCVGSAFVWIISEISVLLVAQFFVIKYVNIAFPFSKFIIYITSSIPAFIISIVISQLCGQTFFVFLSVVDF
jgi:Membrane protein involved in the export of O-antigen and teichoic acid